MSEKRILAAIFVLRLGVAAVFIDFGVGKLIDPVSWSMFVPPSVVQSLGEGLTVGRILQIQGVVEILIGVHLMAGLQTRWAAGLATAMLAVIILVVGWTPIGVRDLGLMAASMALVFCGSGSLSLDQAWRSVRPTKKFPALAWNATLGFFLLALLLRPSTPEEVRLLEGLSVNGPIVPIPVEMEIDERKVSLGRMLFHDVRLSGPRTVSCATCHSADSFGADGRALSMGVDGSVTRRNSPTVFNAAFNPTQFWDGRAADLEAQVDGPIENQDEMAASWDVIIPRLDKDPSYRRMFTTVYGDGITPGNVRNAIAEFEKSLTTPNSPFDRFLRGDEKAMSEKAMRGYETFLRMGCVSCHNGMNIGGNSFQKMGKMSDFFNDQTASNADLGRFEITEDPRDKFAFRVPSLRNVAETAPYFHDGSIASLKDAIQVMARHQLGYEMAPEDLEDVKAFLESLTGDKPKM